MPTFDRRNLGRPFRAKVKHNYKERYLGNYPTWYEAVLVERAKRLELTGQEEPMIGGPLRHAQ